MRRTAGLVCVCLFAAAAAGEDSIRTLFRKDDAGQLPAGWSRAQTGEGHGSAWEVVADATTPSGSGYALAQTAKGPNAFFNLCVLDKPAPGADVTLHVSFKAMAGALDQGGGLVWRYQDHDNYNVARMNPLEDNLRIYKVVAGKRTQLATLEGIKIPVGTWHRLEATHTGKKITVTLDGKTKLEAEDDTFAGKPGKVGLWTKADAQTRFDGFECGSARR